jgi:hypothetical protein
MNGVGARLQTAAAASATAKVGFEARWTGALAGSAHLPIVVQVVSRRLERGDEHDLYEWAIRCAAMSSAAS